MTVLIIIPAYNEDESIEAVVNGIIECFPEYDYLVINDCSTDKTKEICQKNAYHFINAPVNLGIGGAIQTGYLYSAENNYDITIQLDGDGQHSSDHINDLISELKTNNCGMVIGSRFIEKTGFQSSFSRRFGIGILNTVIRLTSGAVVTDATSGFRASNKALTKFFSKNYAQDYPEPEALVSAVLNGFTISEVPVKMNERQGGKSSIHGLKAVYYMIKVTLSLFLCRFRYSKKNRGKA